MAPAEDQAGAGQALREGLSELFACGRYREFRAELGLSKDAVARFMGGEDGALTKEQTTAAARYVSEFGRDMRTDRLVRRGGAAVDEEPREGRFSALSWFWK